MVEHTPEVRPEINTAKKSRVWRENLYNRKQTCVCVCVLTGWTPAPPGLEPSCSPQDVLIGLIQLQPKGLLLWVDCTKVTPGGGTFQTSIPIKCFQINKKTFPVFEHNQNDLGGIFPF